MNQVERYYIYSLLSAVVLADQKIKDVEVETFISLADGFQRALKSPTMETPEEIKAWFLDHRVGINKKVNSDKRKDYLKFVLSELSDFPYKKQVVQAMEAIAMSDNERHQNEDCLIKHTREIWGIRMP